MSEMMMSYDVREMKAGFDETWSVERQERFLIKHNLEKPLSTDIAVWPRAMQNLSEEGFSVKWHELDELVLSLANAKIVNCWIIGISIILTADSQIIPWATPSEAQSHWKFLGYDIAEQTLLSGLLNMGYSEDENQFVKAEFPKQLNKYHLFNNIEDALKFASWCNTRDPGHGPFYPHGLYLIEEIT